MEMTQEASRIASEQTPNLDAVGAVATHCARREVLSFHLGAEEYGIDILKVQEIRSCETPTRIANTPSFVKGVVNLRGVIVPIVDLRLKFALDAAEYNQFTVVIVLNVGNRIVGVVVDGVSDVVQLSADQIKPVPTFNSSIDAGFITGMGCIRAEDRERLLILIDIERMMVSADMGLFEATQESPALGN